MSMPKYELVIDMHKEFYRAEYEENKRALNKTPIGPALERARRRMIAAEIIIQSLDRYQNLLREEAIINMETGS
jgi:hypothetical protein